MPITADPLFHGAPSGDVRCAGPVCAPLAGTDRLPVAVRPARFFRPESWAVCFGWSTASAGAARWWLRRSLASGLVCGAVALGCSTATAAPDSATAGTPELAAMAPSTPPGQLTSYNEITVQRGDTAYSLAREYDLSVSELLAMNGLATHDLAVGQTLRVAVIPPYQVVKGDTLYSLARKHGITVEALQAANSLSGSDIETGQWLAIPAAPQARPVPALLAGEGGGTSGSDAGSPPEFSVAQSPHASDDAAEWRRNALAMLNTPYVYGGNSPTGVDCSSFVVRVFQPLGVKLPRTSAQQAQVGRLVSRASLRGGDLVFFDTVGRGSVTHVGIYLGSDQFVNANSYYGRVVIDRLDGDRYWSPRYLSARRILGETLESAQPSALTTSPLLILRPGPGVSSS